MLHPVSSVAVRQAFTLLKEDEEEEDDDEEGAALPRELVRELRQLTNVRTLLFTLPLSQSKRHLTSLVQWQAGTRM